MQRLASGVSLELFDQLDSTSQEAKRRGGEGEPCWIIARRQTEGYGRRARSWRQAEGDFAGTLLFRSKGPPSQLGQLSFIAGLALVAALDPVIRADLISLKWPNDVLIDHKKAAGILLERIDDAAGPLIAMGVGVNIVSAPGDLDYATARLLDYAEETPAPLDLCAAIDAAFWPLHDVWARHGFAAIRDLWLARASGLNEPMIVQLPGERITGEFEGLDPNGALILRQGAQKRIISAGDVFFTPQDTGS